MADLKSMKVGELRDLAEKSGVEGFEDMNKKQLAETLESSEAGDEGEGHQNDDVKDEGGEEPSADKGGEKVGDSDDEDPDGDKEDDDGEVEMGKGVTEVADQDLSEKALKMKAFLQKQDRVSVFLPLEDGEKRGTTKSVILNGFRLNILKGVRVQVPEQIADVIEDSMAAQTAALENAPEITGEERPFN